MGEQWSPHTAPAIHAEMDITINSGLVLSNTWVTMGIRIPKVPHEVPVENARKQPTRKIMAGRSIIMDAALSFINAPTNCFAPRLSVIAFKVQAKVRIKIAGTMALKPSGKLAIHSLKLNTRRIRYTITVMIMATILPIARP